MPEELKLINAEETIALTQRESELLAFLCLHPNKALKREEILLNVWGKNDFFLGRSMDVFMARLRKMFATEPSVTIETIHKVGYRFAIKQPE
jgi:DNA-binding response OmpR family regulator